MENEVVLWVIIFGGNAILVCIMEASVFSKYFVMGLGGITFIAGFFFPAIWLLTIVSLIAYKLIDRRINTKKKP
ncbi:hypothetical protein ACFL5G_05030 [Candidatus Margulisiibacteriota bacterium]